MASSLFHNSQVLSFWGPFSFPNVFQLEAALLCGLSLTYQVLLVVACHFKLKKAYSIAIHTQKFRKKKLSKRLLYHILTWIYDSCS